MTNRHALARAIAFLLVFWLVSPVQAADDPLAAWNEGPAKQAILSFVQATTAQGSPSFEGLMLSLGGDAVVVTMQQ